MKVFNAVMRAILCYAGQVWGYQEYDSAEGVLLTFVRRLFWLPSYTPNYLIYLETGLQFRLHVHALLAFYKDFQDAGGSSSSSSGSEGSRCWCLVGGVFL